MGEMSGKYQKGIKIALWAALINGQAAAAPLPGEAIFLEKCAMCHLPGGQGAPPAFPPLAGSDWLKGDRPRNIRVLCEGLEGRIVVNGTEYHNVMPAQVLDDTQVAAVLTYVTNAWGNQAAPYTTAEVKQARAGSRFPTFAELEKASAYPPLPPAPAGWTLREVVQLPALCTRLAGGNGGPVYVLSEHGIIYRLDQGAAVPWILPADYADLSIGSLNTLGMTLGPDGRLWVVSNQKTSADVAVETNVVTIWRSGPIQGTDAPKLKPWFRTRYPWGVGPYNHGVSHLAFGPDGMLYVSSGSRTDGGEDGTVPRISKEGETDITACLWRMDPAAATPKIEVVARGIRNAYGFAWTPEGQLFTVSNGPDADAPEEMDAIVTGNHYGFPYQFSDWPLTPKPYPHTPEPPAGLTFSQPVLNLGPSAGGGKTGGLATFDAHSSPAGMMWCGDDYPEPLRGGFLVTRFGNLLATPQDAGFDLLRVALRSPRESGRWQAGVSTLLAPLGRPIDVLANGQGKVLILEYTRPTDFKSRVGWLPGRVLELAPAAK